MSLLAVLLLATHALATATIGIDMGSETFQIGHGRLKYRKSQLIESEEGEDSWPTAISFINDQSTVTDKAENSIRYFTPLIGAPNNTTLTIPNFELVEDEDRAVIQSGDQKIPPELLASHILNEAKDTAEVVLDEEVKDVVLTVPAHWNRIQRQSLISAAKPAKLNVLGLINENTAAALSYGLNRWDNVTDHYVLFYNIGASFTQCSIVKYSLADKVINSKLNKTVESIQVLGTDVNTQFSGRILDERYAKALDLPLLKAQEKKHNLADRKEIADFEFSWRQIEHMLTDPIDNVLFSNNLTLLNVTHFELLGGATKIPKIRDNLADYFGLEKFESQLEEGAAAQGAALFASNLTDPDELKPIWLSDVLPGHVDAKFIGEGFEKTSTVFKERTTLGARKRIKIMSNYDVLVKLYHVIGEEETLLDEYDVSGILDSSQFYNANMTNYFTFQIAQNGFPILLEAENKWNKVFNKTYEYKKEKNAGEEINVEGRMMMTRPEMRDIIEIQEKNKTIRTTLTIHTHNKEFPKPLSSAKTKAIQKSINLQKNVESLVELTIASRESLLEQLKFTKEKLGLASFATVTTPEQRNEIELLTKQVAQWDKDGKYELYQYNEQQRILREAIEEGLDYEEEYLVRDDTIKTSRATLDYLDDRMMNLNRTKEWVDQEDKDDVFNRLKEIRVWLNEQIEEQSKLQLWEKPVLRRFAVDTKIAAAEKALETIAVIPRPRQKMREKDGRTYVRGPAPLPTEGTRGYKAPKKLTSEDLAECEVPTKNKYANYVKEGLLIADELCGF